ncbi:hypothetical protein ACGFZK_24070 [Streptomyces sp. NPDC048257]|uniref:hypothetical protein n=1 Tax=Streptomyces sp. NPDC048257 TaxID=3365526 RepID=UPI00371F837F
MKACEQYVAQYDAKVTGGVAEACYQGQIGNQTSCNASLVAAGATKDVAASAWEAFR